MSETRKEAAELADDLARRTAENVKLATRQTTADLTFDLEPQSFLKTLEDLADQGDEAEA